LGHWNRPTSIKLPPDSQSGSAGIAGISCLESASCTIVGSYDKGTESAAFVYSEVSGKWPQATELPSPSPSAGVAVNGISCTVVGYCTAVGDLSAPFATGGAELAFLIETEASGVWSPRSIALPADFHGGGSIDHIVCKSFGNCEAVGSYSTVSGVNIFAINEANHAWGQPKRLLWPTSATAIDTSSRINSLWCADPRDCAAVGVAQSGPKTWQGFLIFETGGIWGGAKFVARPIGGSTQGTGSLESISCVSLANCLAVGEFAVSSTVVKPMALVEKAGLWRRAVAIVVPSDSVTSGPNRDDSRGVSCPALAFCQISGTYTRTPTRAAFVARLNSTI